jgi:hypothetical protein
MHAFYRSLNLWEGHGVSKHADFGKVHPLGAAVCDHSSEELGLYPCLCASVAGPRLTTCEVCGGRMTYQLTSTLVCWLCCYSMLGVQTMSYRKLAAGLTNSGGGYWHGRQGAGACPCPCLLSWVCLLTCS